jgi:hypothetical protein
MTAAERRALRTLAGTVLSRHKNYLAHLSGQESLPLSFVSDDCTLYPLLPSACLPPVVRTWRYCCGATAPLWLEQYDAFVLLLRLGMCRARSILTKNVLGAMHLLIQ